MTKEKKERYTAYQSIPNRARFWLHSEACYTEEELNQRTLILKNRANSGIHADYLASPISWFGDDSQALINVYEHSWFYSNGYRPRHVLTRDDFHVQPIDGQRLQWPALYNLMQKTGDYLLLRNQDIRQDHLNQPMNFFLLDLNNILKGISQNSNIKQTQEQLESLTRYVRTIEKNTSPLVGSDRLFLANFRGIIEDEIHPQLTQKIESQLLKDRLGELSKTITQLSTERNRILHFALNVNPVNPHPYDFAIEPPDDLKSYPTQAAKNCAKDSKALTSDPMSPLKITMEQLSDCPNFKLINMRDKVLEHYAQAVSDLNELHHFQKIIAQTIDLLGQAGEVYTVHQFREQLSLLLKQIDHFIDVSSTPIEEIIHANTQAYHKAIHDEQSLSFFTKLLTSEKEKLSTFIRNQDTLAQFPSTTSDLAKTSQSLKEDVNQVLIHLNGPKARQSDFTTIAGQAHELNALINSMHHWVKVQHEDRGLEPPKKPEKLGFLAQSQTNSPDHRQSKASSHSSITKLNRSPLFLDNSPISEIPYEPINYQYLSSSQALALPACPEDQCPSRCIVPQSTSSNNAGIFLGIIVLVPIGIILLYLLYQSQNKSKPQVPILGTKEDFEEIKVKLDDLIVQCQQVKDNDEFTEITYEDFIEEYKELEKKYQSGLYLVDELQVLYDEINYFYKESFETSPKSKRSLN